jgi:membrane-bound lytic murein transglycosylase D
LPPTERYVAQRNDGSHRVRRGETLAGIAAASGVGLARLLASNGWSGDHAVERGQVLRIPMPASRAEAGGAAAAVPVASAPVAEVSYASEAAGAESVLADIIVEAPKEPVSQRQTGSAALLPAGAPTGNSDVTDYGVAANDTVVVQAAETLGHFADWCRVDAQVLRALNKLPKNAMVTLGRKLKLDLSHVTAEQFVAERRDYHRQLQDAYFAAHRIAGTENYDVKRGESLWTIAQQHSDMPVWLVAQYNPDVDFSDVRPGTTITLPRVVAINRQ